MRKVASLIAFLCIYACCFSQLDSSLLVASNTPYGALDIRIARSADQYYYLQENKTFSYREVNGVRTNSFLDMTAWDSSPYSEGNMRFINGSSDDFVMNYRLLKPEGYNSEYGEGYPLVLLLHGLQERGNCAGSNCYHGTTSYSPVSNDPSAPVTVDSKLLNNDYNLVHGGSNYLDAHNINGALLPDDPALPARAFPGFVVFPQNLNGWDQFSAEDAIRLVRLLIKKYNIDINRIYINGVSNGGHGAYEVMKRAPWLFAAGILFSAADDASVTDQNLESIVSGIPLWIFQGGVDTKPTVKQTEGYVKKLREAGAIVRYTLYPELGHGTWNKAFSEPDFFTWMLTKRKNDIHVAGDNAIICSTTGEGAKLKMPNGYTNYEWEFNGQVVNDAKQSTYIANVEGNYRGRWRISSSDEWNEWSTTVTVIKKTPVAPQIVQRGTVVLRDPNNLDEAVLESTIAAAHYYWFRNGTLINLPGADDDTTRVVKLPANYGDGVYTLKVSDYDNCLSPASGSKSIFFNDRAPINITAPASLAISATSPSEVVITWQDLSDNEDGFEIWRKANNDLTWVMIDLIQRDKTSHTDTRLTPSTNYQYKIRAVSSEGRSSYSEVEQVQTLNDLASPSVPSQPRAEITSARELTLHWNPSTDDSGIKEYLIYFRSDTVHTNSKDTWYISNFQVNSTYQFSVAAVDLAGNVSGQSEIATIYTKVSGLFYQHSTGDWSSLQDIDWKVVEFKGITDEFTLTEKTQEDFFNFRFDGFLNIVDGGVYQFRLSSNDGSSLYLNDTLTIMNDGIHNLATVTAPIQILNSGPQRITVYFFDNTLSDSLIVEYKGPDTNEVWSVIAADNLRSEAITEVEQPASDDVQFDVFPNPVSGDVINISLKTNIKGQISIDILNSAGKQISSVDSSPDDDSLFTASTNALPNGLYFVLVRYGNSRFAKKITIQR